jgi:hypothetical protein
MMIMVCVNNHRTKYNETLQQYFLDDICPGCNGKIIDYEYSAEMLADGVLHVDPGIFEKEEFIKITVREICEKDKWDEFCEVMKIRIWALNEGSMDYDEVVELSEDQAREIGLI